MVGTEKAALIIIDSIARFCVGAYSNFLPPSLKFLGSSMGCEYGGGQHVYDQKVVARSAIRPRSKNVPRAKWSIQRDILPTWRVCISQVQKVATLMLNWSDFPSAFYSMLHEVARSAISPHSRLKWRTKTSLMLALASP